MKIKCNYKLLVLGLINTIIGILFLVINSSTLLNIVFFIVGGLIIASGGYSLYNAIKQKNTYEIIYASFDILFGILLMFFHKTFMLIIAAVYLILIPTIRIILNKNHSKQLMTELPRLIIGVVIILLTPEGILNILFKIIGVMLIIIGITGVLGSFVFERYIDSKNE